MNKTPFLHWEKPESCAWVPVCVSVRETEREREMLWGWGSGEMVLRNGGRDSQTSFLLLSFPLSYQPLKSIYFVTLPFYSLVLHWQAYYFASSSLICCPRQLLHRGVERNHHIPPAQLVWSAQDPGILHRWTLLALETHMSLERIRLQAVHKGCLVK